MECYFNKKRGAHSTQSTHTQEMTFLIKEHPYYSRKKGGIKDGRKEISISDIE